MCCRNTTNPFFIICGKILDVIPSLVFFDEIPILVFFDEIYDCSKKKGKVCRKPFFLYKGYNR